MFADREEGQQRGRQGGQQGAKLLAPGRQLVIRPCMRASSDDIGPSVSPMGARIEQVSHVAQA